MLLGRFDSEVEEWGVRGWKDEWTSTASEIQKGTKRSCDNSFSVRPPK